MKNWESLPLNVRSALFNLLHVTEQEERAHWEENGKPARSMYGWQQTVTEWLREEQKETDECPATK